MRFGGSRDAAALSAIGTSALMSAGPMASLPVWMQAGMAGIGAFQAVQRIASPILNRNGILGDSCIDFARKGFGNAKDGLHFGYALRDGRPITLQRKLIPYHQAVVGRSGMGKTVYLMWLIQQQVMAGGGLLMVDAKIDIDTLYLLNSILKWAGREHDLIVLNADDPSFGHTYNPIHDGDADEVSARCLALIPSTENQAGSDHYKQEANRGITTLVLALQRAGLAYNFLDLSILMNSPRALNYLIKQVPESDERTNLLLFLEGFKRGKALDPSKLKDTFGGIGGRMFMFGTGVFGKITNSYNPDLVLFDAIRQNKIVYTMLPVLGKDVAAINFAKMLVADLRSAAARIQKLPFEQKPSPVFLGLLDEAGAYTNMSWARAYEQFRSAQIALVAAMQTFANTDAVSPELTEMVLGNSFSKIFFGIGTDDTAVRAADFIGKRMGTVRGISEGGGVSESANLLRTSPEQTMGASSTFNYTEREQELHRVHPDHLKSLGIGEAIVNFGGADTTHIQVPYLKVSRELARAGRNVQINRLFRREQRGIALFDRASDFISGDDIGEMVRRGGDEGEHQGPQKKWDSLG